jgi:hypothetical protein
MLRYAECVMSTTNVDGTSSILDRAIWYPHLYFSCFPSGPPEEYQAEFYVQELHGCFIHSTLCFIGRAVSKVPPESLILPEADKPGTFLMTRTVFCCHIYLNFKI